MRGCQIPWSRSTRRVQQGRRFACAVVGIASAVVVSGSSTLAYADSPAVTDFGQDAAATVMSPQPQGSRALFITFYPDGRQQIEVRVIQGDAIVSFAGEHPSWKLDLGLMWFVQMPVYTREFTNVATQTSEHSV